MSGEIEIKKVTSVKDLKKFIKLQYNLYKNNTYFVPPIFKSEFEKLHWDKNPAFEYCEATYWLAIRRGEIVGRIAAITNQRNIQKTNNKMLRWGWFEAIDNKDVISSLFNTLENFAIKNSFEAIHGPLGFINMDPEGLLIEGFEELGTFASNYNMPYYQKYIEELGYQKDVDWIEYLLIVPEKVPEKIVRVSEMVKRRFGYQVVEAKSKKELFAYAKIIMDLIEKSYSDLYGVVPYTEKQKQKIITDFKPFMDPRFCCLVKDKNDEIIGFGLTMPSLVKAMQKIQGKLFPFGVFELKKALRKNDRLELLLIGLLPEHRGKGVDTLIFNEILPNLIDFGIRYVESNQMLEENEKIQGLFKSYESRQHRRARCYIKHL
jgi:GNAT superfamily N-acetyltransferase